MKERPILFSGPMVRALLAGQKTQTRRAVKPYLPRIGQGSVPGDLVVQRDGFTHRGCPHGQPGDRLYVRETWARPITLDPGPTIYRADYPACVPSYYTNIPPVDDVVWKPSIHMPKSASRIKLDLTDICVERLQDISEEDALAEGIIEQPDGGFGLDGGEHYHATDPRQAYFSLWEIINGPGSIEANPWVWVLVFPRFK